MDLHKCNAFKYMQTYRLVSELLSHVIIDRLYLCVLYEYTRAIICLR